MQSCLSKNLEYNKENNSREKHQSSNNIYIKEPLNNTSFGDLYIIGTIWIDILKAGLIGSRFNLIPIVEAAAPEPPKKPPAMKYSELPLYECPHYEYKDFVEKNEKCPDANVKLIHRFLLPYVRYYRQEVGFNMCKIKCTIKEQCKNTCNKIRDAKRQFKQNMRDPDNLIMRQAVVATSGVAGYFLGAGGGVPRRLFFTTLGLLTGGALCFPKETDEIFRNAVYVVGKAFLDVYNKFCGKEVVLRERLPCKDDLPPPPPARKPLQCPQKK